MNTQRQKYQTQWASQFYAAAELTRRGYLVSLTFGNAPVADLLVVSPNQKHFMVDVKGQSNKNFWLIQPRKYQDDLYFIFVFLPKYLAAPEFFILTCDELIRKRQFDKARTLARKGSYREDVGGMNWGDILDCKGRWDKLPDFPEI